MPKQISDNYKNLLTKPDLSFVNPALVKKEFLDIVEKELKIIKRFIIIKLC